MWVYNLSKPGEEKGIMVWGSSRVGMVGFRCYGGEIEKMWGLLTGKEEGRNTEKREEGDINNIKYVSKATEKHHLLLT